MDYNASFAISAVGMDIERARVEVAALNLANANTVQQAGRTYQPLRVVAQAVAPGGAPAADFATLVEQATGLAESQVPLVSIEASGAAPRRVHEPGHPLADAQGYVSYAGVDTAAEMVQLMSATRAYEANVVAMNTARTLALRALDIGGGNA
ncbi:flagellar basal body rod protein FlgC [Xenophilus sp.]|uniref:flagellar basal body rod protein FlgC n=1 Tax=Xenophilus sp. TaxID=1873499 RepID=UPI0037DCF6FD